MRLIKTADWIEPLTAAKKIPDKQNFVLLYSGLDHGFSGQFSILALNKKREIVSADFKEFETKLSHNNTKFTNAWFGYLGYGLKNCLEKLPHDLPSIIDMPNLFMAQYSVILQFDHRAKKVEFWGTEDSEIENILLLLSQKEQTDNQGEHWEVKNLTSNMSKVEYLEKVGVIKKHICNGDVYQANLTRKFYGNLQGYNNSFDIFVRLAGISPSPYSVFLRWGENSIISSSPERFLFIDEKGNVDTRPIKGSAPRFEDKKRDEKSKIALENSEKDKAENLMIVDLSRNDLSRNCVLGSVKTDNLYKVTSYSTVHHMASTIKGKKLPSASSLDVVKGCFPPGSMTGAPKIKAIQICSDLEKLSRSIYSGGIGWFGGDGSIDLSVVIRTIIISGDKFEFQVGGAITNDSNAENEWEETMIKAKAIAKTLNIKMSKLESF